jgi:membrane dipeptidase
MIELSTTPILLSHSGPRAMWNHPRNLDDDRIRKLAASGGAICMNSAYLSEMRSNAAREAVSDKFEHIGQLSPADQAKLTADTRAVDRDYPVQTADFETYMRGLLHLIQVAGVDHVCFGADWDGGGGVKGFEDIDALPKVTARLRAAGYSEADMQKMWSGNVLRILRIAEEKKGR